MAINLKDIFEDKMAEEEDSKVTISMTKGQARATLAGMAMLMKRNYKVINGEKVIKIIMALKKVLT